MTTRNTLTAVLYTLNDGLANKLALDGVEARALADLLMEVIHGEDRGVLTEMERTMGGAEDAYETQCLLEEIESNRIFAQGVLESFHERVGNKHDSAAEIVRIEVQSSRGFKHPLTLRDVYNATKNVLQTAEEVTATDSGDELPQRVRAPLLGWRHRWGGRSNRPARGRCRALRPDVLGAGQRVCAARTTPPLPRGGFRCPGYDREVPVKHYPNGYTQEPGWYYETPTTALNGPFATEAEAQQCRDHGAKAWARLEAFKAARKTAPKLEG